MVGVEITDAEATASDTRQAMVGVAYLLACIVTGVVFLRWIVVANRNARAGRQRHAVHARLVGGLVLRPDPLCGSRIRR